MIIYKTLIFSCSFSYAQLGVLSGRVFEFLKCGPQPDLIRNRVRMFIGSGDLSYKINKENTLNHFVRKYIWQNQQMDGHQDLYNLSNYLYYV